MSLLSMLRFASGTLVLCAWATAAVPCDAAAPWNLPQAITDRNVLIRYRYLSDGRPSSGMVSGAHGKIWLEGSDSRAIRANITVPTPKLGSALPGLPENLGAMLDGIDLPPADIRITRFVGLCSPEQAASSGCDATANGEVQVGSLIRPIAMPIHVGRTSGGFRISGEGNVDLSQSNGLLGNAVSNAHMSFVLLLPDK